MLVAVLIYYLIIYLFTFYDEELLKWRNYSDTIKYNWI